MATNPTVSAPIEPTTLANPANPPAKSVGRRIPMALPTLKLAVPELPGYVLYWFRGTGQRIQQALNAGYAFVERDELTLNGHGLANSYDADGNTDLGTRVSQAAGGDDSAGQAGRLYLMKIKKELWDEDELLVAERHEQIAGQLRGDKGFSEGGMDSSQRYSRGENRNMFTPRRS
jgi:hypothetical protein